MLKSSRSRPRLTARVQSLDPQLTSQFSFITPGVQECFATAIGRLEKYSVQFVDFDSDSERKSSSICNPRKFKRCSRKLSLLFGALARGLKMSQSPRYCSRKMLAIKSLGLKPLTIINTMAITPRALLSTERMSALGLNWELRFWQPTI